MLTLRRCRLVRIVLDVICVAPNPSLPVAALACVCLQCWDLIPPHLLWPAPALLLWTLEQVRCFCSQDDPGTFLNKAVPLEALRCSACSRPQMCSFPRAAGGRSPALRSRETRVMLPLPVPAAGGPECARPLRLQRQGCRSWSCRGRWLWRWAWRGALSPPPLPLPRPAPSSVLPFSVSLGVGEWFTGWKGSRIWGNLPHTLFWFLL